MIHYDTLRYTTLHYVKLRYTMIHYVTLRYTTLHYVTLRYTTLHYVTLRYTTLHYVTLRSTKDWKDFQSCFCTASGPTIMHKDPLNKEDDFFIVMMLSWLLFCSAEQYV
jgi:hypothetical protein